MPREALWESKPELHMQEWSFKRKSSCSWMSCRWEESHEGEGELWAEWVIWTGCPPSGCFRCANIIFDLYVLAWVEDPKIASHSTCPSFRVIWPCSLQPMNVLLHLNTRSPACTRCAKAAGKKPILSSITPWKNTQHVKRVHMLISFELT